MKLQGKKALITGASRGIGRAIALAFAKEGATVVLGSRDLASLEALAADIGNSTAVRLDVRDPASIAKARESVGEIQILVNNAGIAKSVKVLAMDDEHWQTHLDVNLTGAFRVTRAFLAPMAAAKWGRIINIASTAGKVGFAYTAAYCASKHGLIGFTRALALEMATSGVTVNAICPGFVRTDMADEAARNIAKKTGNSVAEATHWLEALSPQNRLMEPDEVAAVAVLLASEEARGINGQAINIDGGAVVY
ncbi:MAG TPA: SDR family NAD(P)-dependent oxidoreductase [Vicinamibacteria bacterium]|jgi:NAD(P)-dependent dehydrogenase (short-subunit alcohol dehydrogenase family)